MVADQSRDTERSPIDERAAAEVHHTVTAGSCFVHKGNLSEAEGDQPGCQAALKEEAEALGFRAVVYGNMKGVLNHEPTREDVEIPECLALKACQAVTARAHLQDPSRRVG